MEEKNILREAAVFVITVCRNEDSYIVPFLESVLSSTVPVQVILVDNDSNLVSKKKLETFFDRVTILWQEENLGFGIANNVGIKYAMGHGAEYIFLLNMDMRIEPDTISCLLQLCKKHPEYAIISPLCFNFENKQFEKMFFESLSQKNLLSNEDVRLFFSDVYFRREFSKDLYETTYINAAHWFMPIETIKQAGGFNPVFYPIYYEDDEFLYRIARRKLKVGFTPETRVFHDTEYRDSSSLSNRYFEYGKKYITILKSETWLTYYLFRMFFFLGILKNIFLFRKKNLQIHLFSYEGLVRCKKILRKTWLANKRNESIGLYCHIPPECIPPYIKHKE